MNEMQIEPRFGSVHRGLIEVLAVVTTAAIAITVGYRMAPRPSCRNEILELTRLALEASSAKVTSEEGLSSSPNYAVHLTSAKPPQLQLLKRLENLRSLTVFGTSGDADPVTLDERLADLIVTSRSTRLHLMSIFQPLPRTYAALANSSVRDLSLWMVKPEQLPELPALLQELRLGGFPIDEINAAAITRSQSLSRLTIVGADFTQHDLSPWSALRSLESLAIINASPRDAISTDSLSFIRQLSGLREIAVDSPAIDDQFVETILSLPALDGLTLSGTAITNDGVLRILEKRSLTNLALNGDSLTDAAFTGLGQQKRLTSLHLNSPALTNDTARSISHLVELTQLDLSQTKINARGLAEIFRLSKLKVARLNGLEVSSPLLEALAKLPELETVELVESRGYSKAALMSLAASPTLKSLRLSSSAVADDELVDRLRTEHPQLDLRTY